MSLRYHALIRFISVLVIGGTWLFIISHLSCFVDTTSEDLHRLSDVTIENINKVGDKACFSEEGLTKFKTDYPKSGAFFESKMYTEYGEKCVAMDDIRNNEESLKQEEGAHREIMQHARNFPVFIQAYISEEVPTEFESTKRKLLMVLEAMSAHGAKSKIRVVKSTEGDKEEIEHVPAIQVNAKIVGSYSIEDATEAAKNGIIAQRIQLMEEGKLTLRKVFMGLTIKARGNEETLRFIGPNKSPEYEVVVALKSVLRSLDADFDENKKKTIGIARTNIKMNGGMDMDSFRQVPKWQFIHELTKSYNVVDVNMNEPVPEADEENGVDVLVVPLVSNLEQIGMDHLMDYIKAGRPVLLLDDPFPLSGPMYSATMDRKQPNPFSQANKRQPEPKGDGGKFYSDLGIRFSNFNGEWGKKIVWAGFSRYPKLEEAIQNASRDFSVLTDSENDELDNVGEHPTTQGIYEFFALRTGTVEKVESPSSGAEVQLTELISVDKNSGELSFDEYYRPNPNDFLGQSNPFINPPPSAFRKNDDTYIVAAHITGKLAGMGEDEIDELIEEEETENDKTKEEISSPDNINVIFVADIDFLSDNIFMIADADIDRDGKNDFYFDNIPFALNCIDYLAGQPNIIELRAKGRRNPSLTTIEDIVRNYNDKMDEKTLEAQTKAEDEKQKIMQDFQNQINELNASAGSIVEKLQEFQKQQEILQGKMEAQIQKIEEKLEIERDKNLFQLRKMKDELKTRIKLAALLIPPIPIILIGLLVFILYRLRETRDIPMERRRK